MFLQYGVTEYGELVYIDEVSRGPTSLLCPYCGGLLLAKKGSIKAHHFAHAGETCRPVQRDQDVIALPLFDRFDLHLRGRDYRALVEFHDRYDVSYRNRLRLENLGLIKRNNFVGEWQLTHLGKVPFGELSLALFCQEQDQLVWQKHHDLTVAARSVRGKPDYETALADLRIYRAQLQRALSTTLYFLEIRHGGGLIYKIGVTARPIEARLTEIAHALQPYIENPQIEVLRTFPHRGSVELYFKHRYRQHQRPTGPFTEYLVFENRRAILSDLSRMGAKELRPEEQAVLDGQPSIEEVTHIPEKMVVTPELQQNEVADRIAETELPATEGFETVIRVPETTRRAHKRRVALKEYVIVCKQCSQTVTLYRYPGRVPTLCSDECIQKWNRERDRENNRERQRRYRERHSKQSVE